MKSLDVRDFDERDVDERFVRDLTSPAGKAPEGYWTTQRYAQTGTAHSPNDGDGAAPPA